MASQDHFEVSLGPLSHSRNRRIHNQIRLASLGSGDALAMKRSLAMPEADSITSGSLIAADKVKGTN
jgi:hypothetical protein